MSNIVSARDVTKMSRADLEEEAASLAEKRTTIRERAVEVNAQLDFYRALDSMPDASRRIVTLRLEGGVSPEGATSAAASED